MDNRSESKDDAAANADDQSEGSVNDRSAERKHGLVTILSLLAFLVVLILFLSFLGGAVG